MASRDLNGEYESTTHSPRVRRLNVVITGRQFTGHYHEQHRLYRRSDRHHRRRRLVFRAALDIAGRFGTEGFRRQVAEAQPVELSPWKAAPASDAGSVSYTHLTLPTSDL